MNALNLSSCFLLLAGSVLIADPSATTTPKSDLLAEALPILETKYADFKALQIKEGDRLADLVARSGGKISLRAPETASPASPILTETLPGNILYWRLASFTPKTNWPDLASQLEGQGSQAEGIILDLRSNVAPDDYRGAAQVAAFFAPGDTTLDKYAATGTDLAVKAVDHPFRSPVVILTNNRTTGAAEALAACLKADGALVLGRATAGKAAIFEEQKLTSGQVLSYVTAPVILGDGTPLWGHPVIPDIGLAVDDRAEKGALMLIRDNHILDVIQEAAERHRMSEAALVQGDDPEWDAYLKTLEKGPDDYFLLSLPSVHDVVLIDALDSLKAIRVSQRAPLPPPQPEPSAPASASIQ